MTSASGNLGPTLDRMEHGRGFKEALLMNGNRESWTPYAQPLLDAISLMEVLGAHPEAMEKHHFDPACAFKLYHQSGVEVDLWKDEHADGIVSRAIEVELAGRKVRIAEPHDLIAMKLRAHRLKDDYDIAQIVGATAIDEARLRALITPEQFAQFLEIKKRA